MLGLANASPVGGPTGDCDKELSIEEEEKKCHLDGLASEKDQGGKGKEEASSVGHTVNMKNKGKKKRWLKLNMPN